MGLSPTRTLHTGLRMATKTETIEQTKIKFPSQYNVVLHNDDKTTFEFVVELLVDVFDKSIEAAVDLTLKVHNDQKAVAGTYSREVAEQKKAECMVRIMNSNYPLVVTVEEM